ncbi:Glucose--fructose oxidoreductase precursor [Anaerohalosphaera lusitana]|uniref:Glucose--fructose oxidoreductase n=1 Tax=Anaerohalosphaera lusitana TaxID=1936003 RepID=A0A1U9NHY5_9BACT|nr:Gfo/Idh/MocA family oxidoreductase [Anaerohalosphaera lusitana]AQT67377.1 Glucose--fructose oxidoreductase precursor [Anaerohalosphaera lusitana]
MAEKLKTAIMGLSPVGVKLLEAADRTSLFELRAVADSDGEQAQKIAAIYDCQPHNDYRQLVIQPDLQVLLVAEPMHLCREHLRVAIKNNCNILKLLPPALDFEQAADMIRTAEKQKVKFDVASRIRVAPGFRKVKEYIRAQGREKFHLITAVCHLPAQQLEPNERWLADPQLAGGGVILQKCYELLERVVDIFDIPQQIYTLLTSHAPDRKQRLSTTEDTALITMKFSDTLLANVTASRVLGPPALMLRIHSKENYIKATPDSMTLFDNQGEILEQYNYIQQPDNSLETMLTEFAHSITNPPKPPTEPTYHPIIETMSLIESAYVSARTAMPEPTQRILKLVRP